MGSLQAGVAVGSDVGVMKGDEVGVAEGAKAGSVTGLGEVIGNRTGVADNGMFGLSAKGEGEKGIAGVI